MSAPVGTPPTAVAELESEAQLQKQLQEQLEIQTKQLGDKKQQILSLEAEVKRLQLQLIEAEAEMQRLIQNRLELKQRREQLKQKEDELKQRATKARRPQSSACIATSSCACGYLNNALPNPSSSSYAPETIFLMEKDVASKKGTIEGTAPVRQATEGDGPKSSEDDFEHTLELQVAVDSLQAGNEEYLKHYLASREGLDPEQCTLRQTPWKAPPPEEEGGPSLHFIGELDNIQAPGEENESDTGLPNRRELPFIDFDRVEEPYRYEPLRGKRDIRLLRLGPKSDDGIIGQLELESFALDDAPRYFCLSYVWGNADQIMPVTCNSRLMMTTQNLYHALRTCFNRFDNVWLWADGICINQSDHVERAQQVMLMGEIYERAAMVLAHPGHYHYKPTDEAKADELRWSAFDSAPEEMRVENTQEAISIMTLLSRIWEPSDPFSVKSDADWKKYKLPSVETDSGKMTWARLVTFWGQDWFCRAWVLQELVLAKKVVVLYADTVLSLDAVMGFWEKARRHGLPRVLRIGALADECARVVHLTPASYLKGLVEKRSREVVPGVGSSSDDQAPGDTAQEQAEPIRLLDLLCMTRTSLATDDRDKVYALLGLAQDEVAEEIVPDYSPDYTTTRLFIDVARRLVQAGQGHELLHHAGADTRTPGLPSWVPDWTFQSRSELKTSLYGCMGSTRARIRILEGTRPKLAVRGVRFSKVKFAGMAWRYYSHDLEQPKFASFEKVPDLEIPPFNDEDGRNVILAMASLEVEDLGSAEKRYADEGISFAIAKTLAADCSWRGERIDSRAAAEFSDAFEAFQSFYKRGPESEADLVQRGIRVHQTAIFKWLLDFDQAEEDELQRRMVPYTVSMQEASRGRRYAALGGMSIRKKRENKKLGKTTMEMDDRGFIANVPWNAEKKDMVVMFEGFATPFVVRETSSGDFELIGDCYVHGAMDGEILRDAEGLDLGEGQIGVDENGWKYCVRAPDGYTEFEDFVLV